MGDSSAGGPGDEAFDESQRSDGLPLPAVFARMDPETLVNPCDSGADELPLLWAFCSARLEGEIRLGRFLCDLGVMGADCNGNAMAG